jgi:hypothetical protein
MPAMGAGFKVIDLRVQAPRSVESTGVHGRGVGVRWAECSRRLLDPVHSTAADARTDAEQIDTPRAPLIGGGTAGVDAGVDRRARTLEGVGLANAALALRPARPIFLMLLPTSDRPQAANSSDVPW